MNTIGNVYKQIQGRSPKKVPSETDGQTSGNGTEYPPKTTNTLVSYPIDKWCLGDGPRGLSVQFMSIEN